MKRLLAILALVGVVLIVPLTALATENSEIQDQNQAQGIELPSAPEPGSPPDIEQDNQGDPDELGGGFRGTGNPPGVTGVGGPGWWLDPLTILVMSLL